jgi:GSH-dependent disulfide-bond oxidoreductase
MAVLQVYNDATPNGLKVSIALEELALQYNIHRIFLGGEQVTPEFTKLNPNQKIPVRLDSDEDIVLTESGAILLYLAEKTGKLPAEGHRGNDRLHAIMVIHSESETAFAAQSRL